MDTLQGKRTHVVSVNVGMPKDVDWQGKTVHTGIWKSPVTGPVMVGGSISTVTARAILPGTAANSAP